MGVYPIVPNKQRLFGFCVDVFPYYGGLFGAQRAHNAVNGTAWLGRGKLQINGAGCCPEPTEPRSLVFGKAAGSDLDLLNSRFQGPVSYTHLTLPTNREV